MLDKPLQPGLIELAEEVADVRVEYPVDLSVVIATASASNA